MKVSNIPSVAIIRFMLENVAFRAIVSKKNFSPKIRNKNFFDFRITRILMQKVSLLLCSVSKQQVLYQATHGPKSAKVIQRNILTNDKSKKKVLKIEIHVDLFRPI